MYVHTYVYIQATKALYNGAVSPTVIKTHCLYISAMASVACMYMYVRMYTLCPDEKPPLHVTTPPSSNCTKNSTFASLTKFKNAIQFLANILHNLHHNELRTLCANSQVFALCTCLMGAVPSCGWVTKSH